MKDTPDKTQAESQTPDPQAALYFALSKAQGAMRNPDKNRTVVVRSDKGNYNFDYATLDNVIETARKALSDNGIAIVQGLERDDQGAMVLVTRLLHAGGGSIINEMPVVMPQPDERGRPPKIQETGSVITYARRYALCAMLNVAAEEDDDGTEGTGRETSSRGAAPAPRPAAPKPAAPKEDAPKEDAPKDGKEGTRDAFKRIRREIAAAKDEIAIAEVLLTNKDSLAAVKAASAEGYAQLLKAKDDRVTELQS